MQDVFLAALIQRNVDLITNGIHVPALVCGRSSEQRHAVQSLKQIDGERPPSHETHDLFTFFMI
jgi:hypothetical protein